MQGNSQDKASPGQPFAAPRAETWNGMVDAGNAYRAGRLSSPTPPPTRPRETDIIKLRNNCGADRARGEILLIDGKAITDLSDESIWLIGDEPTADGYFGILKEPIENGDVGRVQVSGCCMALIDVGDADHTRARAVAAGYKLESADDGPIEILYAPAGTGELECVVRFGGGGGAKLLAFTLNSAIASNEAPADIFQVDGASIGDQTDGDTVYDPQDMFPTLVEGSEGLCILQGGKHYIINAKCPE
jgi:hypothetical protein